MFRNTMVALVSATFLLAPVTPGFAAPVHVPKPAVEINGASGVIDAQYRHRRGAHRLPREWYRGKNRDQVRGFHRHNKRGYYNGHRGFRHKRRGYRHYNGYWFPPAAFSFGVIIDNHRRGGHARPGYTNPQHVRWCDDKYRSYRVRDNTFKPYHGPRRQCRSPYY
ncbi:MAG: BA14K family protein [Hoeflea sp.]|uniref:BA14K family protein n=1 Tax=Hoeflea sp. TaxID=1940281 RepID=UPI0032EDBA76